MHLKRLTSLRSFAALLVFGNHLDLRGGDVGPTRNFFEYGYTGVAFFFVLSGFVLAWSTGPGASTTAFYIRRFARVYPSHLVMALVALVVPVTISQVTPRDVALNLTLAQSWFGERLNPYTLNGVSWSLSCEVTFYAVLPLILPWARRRPPRMLWMLAVTYWVAVNVITIEAAHRKHLLDAAYVFPPIRLAEFLLGVVAAVQIQKGWRLSADRAVVLAVVGLGLMAASWNRFPAADVGAAILFLVVVVVAAQRDLGRPHGWLNHPWLVYAGQVSFAFYLVHELIIINLVSLGITGWALDPAALAASGVAAVALHHLVERPCEKRLRRIQLPGRAGRVADGPVPLSG